MAASPSGRYIAVVHNVNATDDIIRFYDGRNYN